MNLETINNLIKERQYDKALVICETLVSTAPELKNEILKLRRDIYTKRGMYQEAVDVCLELISDGNADMSLYHTTGFWALFDDQLDIALEMYLKALELGEEIDDEWFRSSQLFSIAYIYCRIGAFGLAQDYLDKLEDKDKKEPFLMPVPNRSLMFECSVEDLVSKIRSGNKRWIF